jgi:hypothetical protein
VIRRAFLAPFLLALLACQRTPEKITRTDVVDAALPIASQSASPPPLAPPAPFRVIPSGQWSSEDRARIQLRIAGTRVTLTEHKETERAPLTVEGPYTSTMERDGSFSVGLTVDKLEKKFLSRCLDCKSKDVWETPAVASFEGEEIAKGAVVRLVVTFSESDRIAEMCLASSKKCTRLVRG